MRRIPGGWRAVVAAAAVVLVALGAVAASAVARPPTGPLLSSMAFGLQYGFTAPAGETWLWGIDLPQNPSDTPLVVDEVSFVSSSNVTITRVTANTAVPGMGVYPAAIAPAVAVAPVQGATIPPLASGPQILVEVARAGAGPGTIEGLRVRYHAGSTTYEDVLPVSLQILEPSPSPSGGSV